MCPKSNQVDGEVTVASYAQTAFLQMFPWERFKNYSPQPIVFEASTMMTVEDENGVVRSVPDKPEKMRAQRWSNLKQLKGKDLVEFIDSEKHFSFRPYKYTPRGVSEVRLYASVGNSLVDIPARVTSSELAAWLAIIATTLLPFMTESKTGVVSYNPQMVMRQLGYEQSAIQISGEMGCSSSATKESQFIGQGKAHIASKFKKTFWPNRVRVGVRSPGDSIYWKILTEMFCAFVENRTPELLEIPKIPTIYHNDPFLRTRKRLGLHVDLKKFSARKKSRSPPTSTEVMTARVEAKRAQEVA